MQQPNSEKTRYSQDDLQEFKGIILDKLKEAKKELDYYLSLLGDSSNDGNSGIMGDGPASTLEKEQNSVFAGRQKKLIDDLTAALGRIANNTYGICRDTGKLIPKERLRSVPHATLCMEAKLKDKNEIKSSQAA
jgi:DnaK suppressor protein